MLPDNVGGPDRRFTDCSRQACTPPLHEHPLFAIHQFEQASLTNDLNNARNTASATKEDEKAQQARVNELEKENVSIVGNFNPGFKD